MPPVPPTLVPDDSPAPAAPQRDLPPSEPIGDDEWVQELGDEWSEKASVFEGDDAPPEPEENFDEVGWEKGQEAPAMIPQLPTKGAMNKMKKADLVELAEGRGVDSEGKKGDIIKRLLA